MQASVTALAFLSFLFSSSVFAESGHQTYLIAGRLEAEKAIQQKTNRLAEMQQTYAELGDRARVIARNKPKTEGYFHSTKEQKQAIDDLAQQIKEIKFAIARHPDWVQPRLHLDELRVGAVGYLKYPKDATTKEPSSPLGPGNGRARAVVGGFGETRQALEEIAAMQRLRMERILDDREKMSRTPVELQVIQVISNREFIATTYGLTLAICNFDTADLVDEAKVLMTKPLVVERTKSYVNILGARVTVFELHCIEGIKGDLEDENKNAGAKPIIRNWSDRSDRFRVQAELLDVAGKSLQLKKINGELVAVAIESLCDVDKSFVESFVDPMQTPDLQVRNAADLASPTGYRNKPSTNAAQSKDSSNRIAWENMSYKTVFRYQEKSRWKEFDASGATIRDIVETERNDDYVQFTFLDRQHQIRLYGDHAEIFKDDRWQWVANGRWINEADQNAPKN